jgi:hypothetical protein
MQGNRAMLPDDVFRARLDRTVAGLRQWGQSISDCAKVAEVQESNHWWFVAIPHVTGACRFELILHHAQKYDLALGGEAYENRPVDELDRLLPLAEAVAAGRVLARHKTSANTGMPLAVETIVRLPDGEVWQADRWLRPLRLVGPTTLEDQWFLPYRR